MLPRTYDYTELNARLSEIQGEEFTHQWSFVRWAMMNRFIPLSAPAYFGAFGETRRALLTMDDEQLSSTFAQWKMEFHDGE